jgi:hypothetical protein
MTNDQDDLFDLIHTLSSNEKRYFSLNSGKTSDEEDNSRILFEALKEMEEYDENQLVKKLRRKIKDPQVANKFIGRLAVEKNRLYYALLRAVRQFHSESDTNQRIKDLITDSVYLHNQGLYSQSKRILDKAKALSESIENLYALWEINWIERTLVWSILEKDFEEAIQQLVNEKNLLESRLIKQFQYQDLLDIISAQYMLNRKLPEEVLKKIDFSPIHEPEDDLSAYARIRRRQCRGFFFELCGTPEENLREQEELVAFWESLPELIKADPFRYYACQANLMKAYSSTNQFQKIIDRLTKLEENPLNTPGEKATMFYLNMTFKFLHFVNSGMADEAKEMVPYIEKTLKTNKGIAFKKAVYLYNVAVFFFLSREFKHCDRWFTQLIKRPRQEVRRDLKRTARLLMVISSIEQNSFDNIDNLLRSVRLEFNNESLPKDSFENQVLSHLKRIVKAGILQKTKPFRQLKEYLLQVREQNSGLTPPGWDEIMAWTESRLSGKSIMAILRERSNANSKRS